VPLDSIPVVVGSAAFRATATNIAARSIVMVKDVGGTIHSLKTARPALSLVTYAEEEHRTVGTVLAAELRARGFAVTLARLWPSSGPASYDSAAAAIARGSVAVFAAAGKPAAACGTVGLNPALGGLIGATARARPTILVSLGNPYLISLLPEVGSYLIGWCSNPVTELAVARALAGEAPITGRLPISLPPLYPRGWGVQRRIDP
jgi:beta-N-acetylhexosaminidase